MVQLWTNSIHHNGSRGNTIHHNGSGDGAGMGNQVVMSASTSNIGLQQDNANNSNLITSTVLHRLANLAITTRNAGSSSGGIKRQLDLFQELFIRVLNNVGVFWGKQKARTKMGKTENQETNMQSMIVGVLAKTNSLEEWELLFPLDLSADSRCLLFGSRRSDPGPAAGDPQSLSDFLECCVRARIEELGDPVEMESEILMCRLLDVVDTGLGFQYGEESPASQLKYSKIT
jgi:hypothetical protein